MSLGHMPSPTPNSRRVPVAHTWYQPAASDTSTLNTRPHLPTVPLENLLLIENSEELFPLGWLSWLEAASIFCGFCLLWFPRGQRKMQSLIWWETWIFGLGSLQRLIFSPDIYKRFFFFFLLVLPCFLCGWCHGNTWGWWSLESAGLSLVCCHLGVWPWTRFLTFLVSIGRMELSSPSHFPLRLSWGASEICIWKCFWNGKVLCIQSVWQVTSQFEFKWNSELWWTK